MFRDRLKSFNQALTNFSLWLIPERITPNALSISRIVLMPLAILLDYFFGLWWGIAFLIVLALTDFIDGRVARGRGLESIEGKQYDAVGDYVLAWSVVGLLWNESVLSLHSSMWTLGSLVVILVRDVSMIFMSVIFKEKADQVPSLMFGKIKAALFIIALLLLLGSTSWYELREVGEWILYAATFFALISWGQYLYYFRKA